MSKEIRVKVIKQPKPDMRKLAQALLLLVEQQRSKDQAPPRRKAS
jgi:hypothetical protein